MKVQLQIIKTLKNIFSVNWLTVKSDNIWEPYMQIKYKHENNKIILDRFLVLDVKNLKNIINMKNLKRTIKLCD